MDTLPSKDKAQFETPEKMCSIETKQQIFQLDHSKDYFNNLTRK